MIVMSQHVAKSAIVSHSNLQAEICTRNEIALIAKANPAYMRAFYNANETTGIDFERFLNSWADSESDVHSLEHVVSQVRQFPRLARQFHTQGWISEQRGMTFSQLIDCKTTGFESANHSRVLHYLPNSSCATNEIENSNDVTPEAQNAFPFASLFGANGQGIGSQSWTGEDAKSYSAKEVFHLVVVNRVPAARFKYASDPKLNFKDLLDALAKAH